jgi:hypothetical protein
MAQFHRNDQGLYVLSRDPRTRTSYHEDGKYWTRVDGKMVVKMVREPLSAFTGAETLLFTYIILDDRSPIAVDPAAVRLKREDIVLDHAGIVGLEPILSDQPLQLPPLPDRLDQRVFVKACKPLLIIEAFTVVNNALPGPRFLRPPKAIYGTDPPARI